MTTQKMHLLLLHRYRIQSDTCQEEIVYLTNKEFSLEDIFYYFQDLVITEMCETVIEKKKDIFLVEQTK